MATYIPEEDLFQRLPDGRRILAAPKGVPISEARVRELKELGVTGLPPGGSSEPAPEAPVTNVLTSGILSAAQTPPPQMIAGDIKPLGVEGAPAPTVAPEATEAAQELAAEKGIDLSTIKGTGQDGRITKTDVEKAVGE